MTVTGLAASTAAATSPAFGPAIERTARNRTSTASIPASTCGSATAQWWNPNRRTDSA